MTDHNPAPTDPRVLLDILERVLAQRDRAWATLGQGYDPAEIHAARLEIWRTRSALRGAGLPIAAPAYPKRAQAPRLPECVDPELPQHPRWFVRDADGDFTTFLTKDRARDYFDRVVDDAQYSAARDREWFGGEDDILMGKIDPVAWCEFSSVHTPDGPQSALHVREAT